MGSSDKKPLHEVYWSKLKLVESNSVNESTDNSGNNAGVLGTVEGPFAEIENKNRNNRVYSKELWEGVINSGYVKEMMDNRTLLGEGDHPEDRFEISIPEVSHSITDLWLDETNNLVMGRADILDTPVGNIVYTLVEYGSKIGISSRAAGSLKEVNGVQKVVEDDYTFFTFDFVPNPGFKTSRLDKREDQTANIAASNDRVNENEDIDFESMRDELLEKIESLKEENISAVESVIKSIAEKDENYNVLIDKVEEKKESFQDKKDNSGQENTYSLLEESYRKVYKLEEENSSLKEQNKDLEDEVNSLSNELKKARKDAMDEVNSSIYKEELTETRKKLDKTRALVKDLKRKDDRDKLSESKLERLKEEKTEYENKVEELEGKLKTLERKSKSKELFGNLMESRVKEISDEKVRLEKADSTNESNLSKLEGKLKTLEDYMISQIAGRTGAEKSLVEKYIPEDFSVEDIVEVESKIKKDLRNNKSRKFDRPVVVNKEKDDEEMNEREKKQSDLTRLVASVRGK